MHYEYLASAAIGVLLLIQLALVIKRELKRPPHIKHADKEEDTTKGQGDIR